MTDIMTTFEKEKIEKFVIKNERNIFYIIKDIYFSNKGYSDVINFVGDDSLIDLIAFYSKVSYYVVNYIMLLFKKITFCNNVI